MLEGSAEGTTMSDPIESPPHREPVDLVQLDRDHPGFRDPVYRKRRNEIAAIALGHQQGAPVPSIEYTDVEHGVWHTALTHLAPLHEKYACRAFRDRLPLLPFDRARIPQFSEINPLLQERTGFTMVPVAGLVTPRIFMQNLAKRIFLATQYIRHHSAPLYTPEPDVIHELIGHAALLADPEFARINQNFGDVTLVADERTVEALIRVYWYSLEFGVVKEDGELKAVGAGLLSSFGELGRFETEAELLPLNLEEMAETPFDPTDYQVTLFVSESTESLLGQLTDWLASKMRHGAV
jgi:phenylalanine-4-hydroxylase